MFKFILFVLHIYNSHHADQSALQKSKIIPHTQKTDQTKKF